MITVLIGISLLITVVGIQAISSNRLLTESFQELTNYEETVDVAAEASSYAKRVEGHLFLYLMLGDSLDKEKFGDRHNSLEEQIAILENDKQNLEVFEQLNLLKSFSDQILEYGNQLIEAYDQNPEEFDFQEHSELIIDFQDSTSGARKAGVSIVALETTELNQKIEKSVESGEAFQWGMIIGMMVLLTVVPISGILVSRSIAKPLQKLSITATAIGNGKLGIQSDIKLKNEIGYLADSFNKMSNNLQINQKRLLEAERHSAIEAATWVGHDLRNPLQAIQNSTYIIYKQISKLPNSSAIRKNVTSLLKRIDDSVMYSENIIRNLKDFGSKEEPIKTKTDINALIRKTLSQIDAPKNTEIIKDLGQIPDIEIDADMMSRVFMNVVTNAIQAMENGGKLKVSTKKTTGFVEVIFQDTGKGMSKETMEKIFDPFFTTKAKGMGIGLAICKKFVERNGGNISVESELGKGTTFIVKLHI